MLTEKETTKHPLAAASGVGSLCAQGFLMFAKYMEWHLPSSLIVAIGVASIGGLLFAGVVYLRVAWDWLKNHRKPRLGLEPQHLIIIGLAGVIVFATVAAAGVILQRQQPAKAADGNVAATHIQLGPEISKPATTPLKKMLTAYDVEHRIRAIDELYAFLNSMLSVTGTGEKLKQVIQQKIASKEAISALDQYADALEKAIEEYRRLTHKFEYLPDLFTVAQADNGPIPIFGAIASSRNLRAEIQELEQRNQLGNGPEYLRNNIRLEEWKRDADSLWPWINDKKQTLARKRGEYEQAEVYPNDRK